MAKGPNRPNARARATGAGRANAPSRRPNPAAKPNPRPTKSARPKQQGAGANRSRSSSQPVPTTSVSAPWRRRLERASAPTLLRMHAMPRWLPSLIMFTLLLAGVFLPGGVAALALGLVVLILVWLLTLSWPALSNPAKLGRLFVVGLVIFAALVRLSGLHFVSRH